MAFKPRRNKKPYKKRSAYKSKKPKAIGVSTAIAKYVNRVVHQNIENKQIGEKNDEFFSSYIFGNNLNVMPIYPCAASLVINQGTGQGERVGNTIKTRKLLLKYILHPAPYDTQNNPSPCPQEVMIWIGYLKNNRMKEPDTTDFGKFFQYGSINSSPTSLLWDTMSPVNKDLFTICKVFRHKIGTAAYQGDGHNSYAQYFNNNDFKLNASKTVDCTKFINKTLKFDDTTVQSDTGLYLWMTSVNADGTLGNSNMYATHIMWTLDYFYEDA